MKLALLLASAATLVVSANAASGLNSDFVLDDSSSSSDTASKDYFTFGELDSSVEDDAFFASNNTIQSTYASLSSSSSSSGCPPRVRKPFHRLSSSEKTLYLEAVKLSLDQKYNVHFTDIHMNSMTVKLAHKTCAFLLWHRTITLAYENMLRSLDDRFKCLTVTWWDFMRDYAKFASGECKSLEECSEFLQAIGGTSTNFETRDLIKINNREFYSSTGCCANGPLCKAHCESMDSCQGCIPRGDWHRTVPPPTFSYASIAQTLIGSSNYEVANKNIQRGVHNDFHDIAGGAFSTYASTTDPLFFPFHATIDMLHMIYYKCGLQRARNAKPFRKKFYKKKRNPLADHEFMKCSYIKNLHSPQSTDEIKMVAKSPISGHVISVYNHPVVGKFFEGIGPRYHHMIDSTSMGEHSYDYDMDLTMRKLLDTGLQCNHPKYTQSSSGVMKKKKMRKLSTSSSSYASWYTRVHQKCMKIVNNDFVKVAEQLEVVECQHHEAVLGGVRDAYTPLFQEAFGMKGVLPRCRNVLNRVKAGKRDALLKWEEEYNN